MLTDFLKSRAIKTKSGAEINNLTVVLCTIAVIVIACVAPKLLVIPAIKALWRPRAATQVVTSLFSTK